MAATLTLQATEQSQTLSENGRYITIGATARNLTLGSQVVLAVVESGE